MDWSNSRDSTDGIQGLLWSIRSKGVRLWSENGQLRYQAPKGVLNQKDIEGLRAFRGQIIASLAVEAGPTVKSCAHLDRAPLAFSQRAHWHLYRLRDRSAIRQIASASRLCGRLNVPALQQALTEVVRRHDALRTQIVSVNDTPIQAISGSGNCEIRMEDLSGVSEARRQAGVFRAIDEQILEPIDVAVDPLLAVRVLKLREDEHVLIVAMEHIISDAFSKAILLRELFAAYTQVLQGRSVSLPEITIQFADYAVWQQEVRRPWMERQAEYWMRRLGEGYWLRFPDDKPGGQQKHCGAGTVPVRIGRELKEELQQWCRHSGTTLAMGVLTVYAALVLRWCEVSETVIVYTSDGRNSPKLENTIGFFASTLYVRVALRDHDSFLDLLDRVREEFCIAHEHADSSCLIAQLPCPEFTKNTCFNWIPQGTVTSPSSTQPADDAMTCSTIRFTHPMLRKLEFDREPGVQFHDVDGEIVGSICFDSRRISEGTMEIFARNFLVLLERLLRHPQARVKDAVLERPPLIQGDHPASIGVGVANL